MIKFITASMISIILILSSSSERVFSSGEKMCVGYQFSKDCLKENFSELYLKNYDLFFEILYSLEKEALSCADLEKTSEYLSLIEKVKGNAEVAEVFSGFIEKLALSNPTCLLDSLMITEARPRKLVFWRLKRPIYRDSKKIGTAIHKYRNQKNYVELFREMDRLTSYPEQKLLN